MYIVHIYIYIALTNLMINAQAHFRVIVQT